MVNLRPQERTALMEAKARQDREVAIRMGMEALYRRKLHLLKLEAEDEEMYNQLMNGKIIYQRPKPEN